MNFVAYHIVLLRQQQKPVKRGQAVFLAYNVIPFCRPNSCENILCAILRRGIEYKTLIQRRFFSLSLQWWDAESRQTALYLVNGWDLRPALWRASCWPFLRNILLKKFLDQSNFIAHFCKKCEIPLYSPFFLGFATESRHPFFAQKYWF